MDDYVIPKHIIIIEKNQVSAIIYGTYRFFMLNN